MSLDVAIISKKRYPICGRVPCIDVAESHEVVIDLTGQHPGLGLVTVVKRGSDVAPLNVEGLSIKSMICTMKNMCVEWMGDRLVINGSPLSIYLSVLFDELLAELSEINGIRTSNSRDRRSKYCVDRLVDIVLDERRRGASITLMGLESLAKVGNLEDVDLPARSIQVLKEVGVVDDLSLIDPSMLVRILTEVRRRVYP